MRNKQTKREIVREYVKISIPHLVERCSERARANALPADFDVNNSIAVAAFDFAEAMYAEELKRFKDC